MTGLLADEAERRLGPKWSRLLTIDGEPGPGFKAGSGDDYAGIVVTDDGRITGMGNLQTLAEAAQALGLMPPPAEDGTTTLCAGGCGRRLLITTVGARAWCEQCLAPAMTWTAEQGPPKPRHKFVQGDRIMAGGRKGKIATVRYDYEPRYAYLVDFEAGPQIEDCGWYWEHDLALVTQGEGP